MEAPVLTFVFPADQRIFECAADEKASLKDVVLFLRKAVMDVYGIQLQIGSDFVLEEEETGLFPDPDVPLLENGAAGGMCFIVYG